MNRSVTKKGWSRRSGRPKWTAPRPPPGRPCGGGRRETEETGDREKRGDTSPNSGEFGTCPQDGHEDVHRPRRHRRLLRRRRGPPQPVARGQAGHRRRPAPRARRGLDLLLRGAQVRRPLGHAAPQRLQALPPGRLHPRQLPGLPVLLRQVLPHPPRIHARRRGHVRRRGLPRPDPLPPALPVVLGDGPRHQGPRRARDGAQGLGRRRAEQDPGQACHQAGQAGRLLRDRAGPGGGLPPRPRRSTSLPGIGPKTQVLLRMLNIQKIGDLWGLPRSTLHSLFGLGGDDIYLQSRGIDSRPVVTSSRPQVRLARDDVPRGPVGPAPAARPSRLPLRPAHARPCARAGSTPTSSRSRPATRTSARRSGAAFSSPRARR